MNVNFHFGNDDDVHFFDLGAVPRIGDAVFVTFREELWEERAYPGTYQDGDLDMWRRFNGTSWTVLAVEHEVSSKSQNITVKLAPRTP